MSSSPLDIGRVLRAARYHASFRLELILALVLTPLALWLGDDGPQRALLIGALLLVLIVELLNSAVETAVDRIGSEHHELSGKAKDLGSAAVLLSLINVALVWGLVPLW